jgi:hypothetical protein
MLGLSVHGRARKRGATRVRPTRAPL